MKFLLRVQPHEKFNTYSHFFAVLGAFVGCAYLMGGSIYENDWRKVFLFAVYSASTVGLFLVSSLYHGHQGEKKSFFKKLDHLGIYLKIAGNYTPYAVLTLPHREGSIILLTVWSLAAVGAGFELFIADKRRNLSYIIYVVMASTIVIAAKPFLEAMPTPGLIVIGLGFVSYLIGFYFYLNDTKIRRGHEIWHVGVVVGSFFHFLPLAIYTVSFPWSGKEHLARELVALYLPNF